MTFYVKQMSRITRHVYLVQAGSEYEAAFGQEGDYQESCEAAGPGECEVFGPFASREEALASPAAAVTVPAFMSPWFFPASRDEESQSHPVRDIRREERCQTDIRPK